MKKIFVLLVMLLAYTQTSIASIIISEDFNRSDGAVGSGWDTWAGGGDILNQELRTNFRTDGGGISRNAPIPVGQRITFSFDFHSDVGGWAIQINTVDPQSWTIDTKDRLIFLRQHSGERNVRYKVGANLYDLQLTSPNARQFTQVAHVSGVIDPDLSAIVNVDYNDGGPIATFDFASPGIDPSTIPQGSLLSIGNSNDGVGNSFFDNYIVSVEVVPEPCSLILICGGCLFLRKYRK